MSNVTYDFAGQVALVTGAASGMGLAAARAFAQAGAAVVLTDIDEQKLQATVADLIGAGYKVLGVAGDIADESFVKSLMAQTVNTYGRLDAAFNNAGIQSPAVETADVGSEVFDQVNAINLRGVWLCMKYQLQQMRKQGSGAIVNNSSLGGLVGVPGRAAYHAAKHGVIGMTKSAGLEYADRGVRINAICPGIIETPMVAGMLEGETEIMNEMMRDVPIRRLGTAQEVADAVLWLCSPGSRFIVGVALPVDGGYTAR
ncbi:MAG: oxidoreductase [Pseudomonadales bacterium]|nr:oxidoreductase [Pseudomonadales bacterium]|tara:strand:- start:243 stop:1013 length:771 start_codon:yes stop_codon:yes gene_type:complete